MCGGSGIGVAEASEPCCVVQSMTTAEIARLVQGELIGDPDLEIVSGHALERATSDQLAFWDRRPGERDMPTTQAGCVIADDRAQAGDRAVIRVAEPRRAFARAMRALIGARRIVGSVDPSARVDAAAHLGEQVQVGPFAVIESGAIVGSRSVIGAHAFVAGDARLGIECRLEPGAKVYGNVRLGDRVVLYAGAVVGADGFGLVLEADHYEQFPQVGGVQVGNDVEIGANSCVDRGALDDTRIGDGTKLDNLVHIGHNCQIGRHVVMAAQVGLSGGVTVEDYAVLGGQAGIGDRARIGARVKLGGQAGLLPGKYLAPDIAYWGTPARPLREELGRQALVSRLPKLVEEISGLRRRVRELESS